MSSLRSFILAQLLLTLVVGSAVIAKGQEATQPIDLEQTIYKMVMKNNLYIFPARHGKLYIRNIQIVGSTAEEMKLVKTDLPDSIVTETYEFVNCGSETLDQQQTMQVIYKKESMISVTRGFVGTSATKLTISAKVAIEKIADLSFAKENIDTTQISLTNGSSQSFSEQVTETEVKTIKVPPETAMTYDIQRTLRREKTFFKGTVTVSAEIWQSWGPHPAQRMKYEEQMWPLKQRTFPVEGEIYNVTAKSKRYIVKTTKLANTSPECTTDAGTEIVKP